VTATARTYRVLVVGVGSIGERHVRCFQRTKRVALSICDVDEPLARDVGARYGIETVHTSFSEALESAADAAVICTPAHLHVEMATSLAERGMHLLIEKPLSTTLDGVDDLVAACERCGVRVSVAYVSRAHPALAHMRDAIRSGRFGRPLELVAASGQHFPSYRPAYREIYYRDRATGGGAIQDALTHLVNSGEWIVGPLTKVSADAAHLRLEGVDVEDTVHAMARHGDVLASYSLNQHQSPNETTLTVVCEGGTCRFEYARGRWSSMTEPDTPWSLELELLPERDELFVRQAEQFLDVLDGDAAPLCTVEESAQTLRAVLAMLRSVETGSGFLSVDDNPTSRRHGRTMADNSPHVSELFDLTGKRCLVTGASGWLGTMFSRALAEAGASVIASSRALDRAIAVRDALPDPERHHAVALDHMDEASIVAGFEEALEVAGRIDVLVNNGNEPGPGDWTDVTLDGFDRQTRNCAGYFELSRRVREHAVKRGGGASIILLGSMYGLVGSYPDAYADVCPASSVAYHALKGGVLQMTRHLAVYWSKDGVRVNALSPGPFPAPQAPDEMVERLKAKSPMGRMGAPWELKGALVFLASDASSYVTGHNLVVDGGWTAW